MTLHEKYMALLKDLNEERVYFGERWAFYYDRHIAELEAAIEERYGIHHIPIQSRPIKPLWATGDSRERNDAEVRSETNSDSPESKPHGDGGNGGDAGLRDMGVERGDNSCDGCGGLGHIDIGDCEDGVIDTCPECGG